MKPFARKNFLINKNFQIKFSIYILIVLLVLSAVYTFASYSILENMFSVIENKSPELSSLFQNKDKQILKFLLFWQIGFSILIFLMTIFITHKIAGPIYNVCQKLKQMRANKKIEKIIFRKGDYFQELSHEINQTLDVLKESNSEYK